MFLTITAPRVYYLCHYQELIIFSEFLLHHSVYYLTTHRITVGVVWSNILLQVIPLLATLHMEILYSLYYLQHLSTPSLS